jgi:16S rRNA G966 N2-methylase RsmD
VTGGLRAPYSWLRRTIRELLFERRYGVRTAGRIGLDELGVADEDRVYYIPANWWTLRRTLPRREMTADDVFIDLGSGMGRMVLEATRYPFKRVIGVELSRDLHDIARTNLERGRQRRRCGDVQLVHSDVLEYDVPDDVTVVFMNNPFRGPVFVTVVERLVASVDRNPRQVTLIYYNPVEEAALLATGRIRHVATHAHTRRAGNGSPFGVTHTIGC